MKVGRNDKCPCGSGLKFKKCCLIRMEEEKAMLETLEQKEWKEWFDKDCEEGAKNLAEQDANIAIASRHVPPVQNNSK